jgi:hypothetical protein
VTEETPNWIPYDASSSDSLSVSTDQVALTAIHLSPPPTFEIRVADGQPTVTVHHDGRLEYGPGYQPDEAARLFWQAVDQQARNIQFGAPLNATVNAHLKAGQEAQRKVERLDQMAAAWLERLPDTIRTATVVEAVHRVTRGDAG